MEKPTKTDITNDITTDCKKILLKTNPSGFYVHFVHCMQYFYWVADMILSDINITYIVLEPETSKGKYNYLTNYVKCFIDLLRKKLPKFTLIKNYNKNDIHKEIVYEFNKPLILDNFILNNKAVLGNYLNWFPNNNSNKIRNLFLTNNTNNSVKIGLINRLKNRRLLNYKQICDDIFKRIKLKVDVTYFEDKTFENQIKFFNDHNIIITPHGAQMCSIPFSPDNALIIELVHEEWHPYDYFTGLSKSSNKYHVMCCDDHTNFPQGCSNKYKNKNGRSDNKKLDIITNPNKIIDIIEMYLKNKNKLETQCCYLK